MSRMAIRSGVVHSGVSAPADARHEGAQARPRLLVVEDDPNIVELLSASLRFAGFEVSGATNGAEALEYIFCTGAYAERHLENPRVILLDKKLPFVDGMEVLRRIRADPRTHLIPVVMLTSSAADRDIIQSYHLRVNSYIVKPMDFEQFSKTVQQLSNYWLTINRQPTGVN